MSAEQIDKLIELLLLALSIGGFLATALVGIALIWLMQREDDKFLRERNGDRKKP